MTQFVIPPNIPLTLGDGRLLYEPSVLDADGVPIGARRREWMRSELERRVLPVLEARLQPVPDVVYELLAGEPTNVGTWAILGGAARSFQGVDPRMCSCFRALSCFYEQRMGLAHEYILDVEWALSADSIAHGEARLADFLANKEPNR